MTYKENFRAEIEKAYNEAQNRVKLVKDEYWEGKVDAYRNVLCIFDSLQEEHTTSVWHDISERPVASKTKIVLYTNGKWDMFKAYETKDDHDNYWAGVNQALEEKGVLVKRWAYVEDLLKL